MTGGIPVKFKTINKMKNNLFFAAFVLLVAASCTNNTISVEENQNMVPVRVHVEGFSVSQEMFPGTRAGQDISEYTGVKTITVAFYTSEGTEQSKTTQMRASMPAGDTFGDFSLSLPMGSYTMVVLASGSDYAMTLTSPTQAGFDAQEEHVRETFAATQAVNISSNEAVNINATLSRIISKVMVVSTDNRTADVANIRTTFSAGGTGFNPTTGFATTNTGFSNTVRGSVVANSPSSATNYLFLATDEQMVNVTIETLDADGAVLFSKTVNNVPLRRNRVTTLTGAMFTNTGIAGAFQVNTDWLTENDVSF